MCIYMPFKDKTVVKEEKIGRNRYRVRTNDN